MHMVQFLPLSDHKFTIIIMNYIQNSDVNKKISFKLTYTFIIIKCLHHLKVIYTYTVCSRQTVLVVYGLCLKQF